MDILFIPADAAVTKTFFFFFFLIFIGVVAAYFFLLHLLFNYLLFIF
jgi:hypothetical protein